MAADEAEARGVAAYEAREISGVAGLSEGNSVDLLAPLVDCVPPGLLLHCFELLSFWLLHKSTRPGNYV